MKRYFLIIIAALVACASFAGAAHAADGERKLSIVATIFPAYDWVREIIGGESSRAETTMLLDSGVDFHSFQPTVDDILKISTCDLFVCVGGESDEWVDDALREAVNKNMRVVKLLDAIGDRAKIEEIVEGMEREDEHDHEDDHDHEGEHDEHVWLSLKNARVLVRAIADVICEIDPARSDAYRANAAAYDEKLASLDERYHSELDGAKYDTLVFGDRFPFRYLVDDYGLKYYAAFSGCSAETEASFKTIAFLAGKVDELDLHTVIAIEGSDRKIAETVARSAKKNDPQIVVLDSLQSVTAKDAAGGAAYLSIMERDLEALKKALR